MKFNIIKCNASGKQSDRGKWWKWNEICDRCGNSIFDDSMLHSKEPDTTEADFCSECFKSFISQNISYQDAKMKYKRE